MAKDENQEYSGFNSGIGTESNPILLPEVIVYGKRPNWFKRNVLNPINRGFIQPVGKFINDEILLNKDNIRVRNAQRNPEAMNAVQEGGNIAGAIIAAPFAAYTAALTAPVLVPALKTAGLISTPSTWVGGFFNAFGTLAPAWLLNSADIGASAYFASLAGKEIDKNGLNWKTGTNALLSLAPFTREESAIKAVGSAFRNPALSVGSVIDDFRAARNAINSPKVNLAREFNKSVRNTRFVNIPIEHVSTKGITEGAGLNPYSSSDVGFHFSPAGSPTTYNILQATNAPFVRTGTWTYTNNTKPVFVFDKGNWRYSYNPEIYQGVNPGKTIAENTIALDLKGPNFTYINNYEGRGAKSYMTTLPNFGLLLSKNIIGNQSRLFVFEIPSKPNSRILAKNLGVITTPEPKETSTSGLGGYVNLNNFSVSNNKLTADAIEQFILPWEQRLRQFYNSGFYARRLAKAGLLSKRDDILSLKNKNLNRVEYGIEDSSTMGNSYGRTSRYSSEVNPKPYILFNIDYNYPLRYAVIHEGSHASSLSIPEIRLHNDKLLQNIWDNVRPEMKNNPEVKEYIEYITDANIHSNNPNALVSEMGGLLLNAFLHMLRNNLTVDLLLSDIDYINKDQELRNAIAVFNQDYLKKLLVPEGIISSVLLATNNQNNDK